MKKFLLRVFRIKTLFALGFVVAALASVLAIAIVIVNVRGQRAWDAYAADARQRGVKMTLDEYVQPPLPDAENLAAVPLFSNPFTMTGEAQTKAQEALSFPSKPETRWGCSMSDGQLSDLSAWQQVFVNAGTLSVASDDPGADVLAAIEKLFGPTLAQLAEAERRPQARFPVKWERGFMAELRHLQPIQAANAIHRVRLAAHLARHEHAAAFAEIRGILRLYRAMEKEPALISGLVRIATLAGVTDGAWEGLVRGEWDDSELAEIQAELGRIDVLSDYTFAIASERAGMNGALALLRAGRTSAADNGLAEMSQDAVQRLALRGSSCINGLLAYNQVAINRYFDTCLARIDTAAGRWHDLRRPDDDLFAVLASTPKRLFYCLYVVSTPAVPRIEKRYLSIYTTVQLTCTAFALERCRRADGAYPETLDALAPKYIDAPPHDVIDGQPLRYRNTDDGRFLLYSVGMNAKDDGGKPGDAKSASDQLDWAWRWPAP